jgi:hypothetical protein
MHAARRSVALFGSALLLALGLVVVFATGGNAASGAICPSTGPSCIDVSLFPRYLAVGSNGLAIAKFTNEAGATATHTVVAVMLPTGTSAAALSSVPAASCSTDTVSCSFGNVTGGSTVKVYVQFTADSASSAPATATAQVSFDEGNGNSGSPSNDTILSAPSNGISIVDSGTSTALNGKCSNADTVGASTSLQAITAAFSSAVGLPCAPVDSGIDLVHLVAGSNDRITFVDLPFLTGDGLATVDWVLVTLPKGTSVNKFVLHESPDGTTGGDPTTWPVVQPCVSHAPPAGQDSCIDSTAKFGSKGIELTLKVLGQGIDPAWWG